MTAAERGGARKPLTEPLPVLEFAYGLLWFVANNTRTLDGRAISKARKSLLPYLGHDDQTRGIARARAYLTKCGLNDAQMMRRMQTLQAQPQMPGIATKINEVEPR